MKSISVFEYLEKAELIDTIVNSGWEYIPLTIERLEEVLEDLEINIWSFDVEDVKSGAVEIDPAITVLVEDAYGKRYFELKETETW